LTNYTAHVTVLSNDESPFGCEGCATLEPVQRVRYEARGVVPGVTYRFSVWGKLTESAEHDLLVCFSTYGSHDDPFGPDAVCSATVRPYNTWQLLSVDATAQEDFISLWMISVRRTEAHAVILWENPFLTVSPILPTVTPSPTSRPTRPAPIPFDANGLYDAMLQAKSYMEQLGGSLDRAMAGEVQGCEPFVTWYNGLVAAPLYDGVPAEWGDVYAEYDWAVSHVVETTGPVIDLCLSGGGKLNELNFGRSRMGISDAVGRLTPAVATAAAMLGR
jgi:hypothetical protein